MLLCVVLPVGGAESRLRLSGASARNTIRVRKRPLPTSGARPAGQRLIAASRWVRAGEWVREIHALRGYTASMSTGVSVDEFQALEQKVLRAVELVKREREARAAAEAEVAALREELATQAKEAEGQVRAALREKEVAERQVGALNQERETVRQRVEKMLQQMDELL